MVFRSRDHDFWHRHELFWQQDDPIFRTNPLLPEESVPSNRDIGLQSRELRMPRLIDCVHNILISSNSADNIIRGQTLDFRWNKVKINTRISRATRCRDTRTPCAFSSAWTRRAP